MSSQKGTPLFRLLRYADGYRGRIWLATICSILNKVFDLAPPLLIGAAVDIVVKREDSLFASWGLTDLNHQLYALAGLTILVWALESLFEFAFQVLWRNLAQQLQHECRLDTWRHLLRLETSYFEQVGTGSILAVLNDDVNQLERFLDGGANSIIQVLTTVVCVGGVFFYISPTIALLAMVPIPFILLGAFRFQHRIAPLYAGVRRKVGELSAGLTNSIGGIATVKSYTAEGFEIQRLDGESREYMAANRKAITTSSAFVPLIRMVILVGFTATLIVGGQKALAGTMAVGSYSVLIFLTQRLLWPLTGLAETVDQYQRAMASVNRIMDLMDRPVQILEGRRTIAPKKGEAGFEFENLTFAYTEGHPILKNVDISIPAGQTVGIVGPTGSGKTTLVKLLLRYHDPISGSIRLDGVDLKELSFESLRGSIGLVSQDVFLFHGSVRDNIAYGSFDADDAAIQRAAELAEAHDFISKLPDGYETIVGERGQKLSGGQRQRLSIARAILKDPAVLILDEATSAVDNETEAAIQRSLDRISKDRTTIIIAHRLSTVRNADKLYVLESGQVAEVGSHESLLAGGGLYKKLWDVQTGSRYQEPVVS